MLRHFFGITRRSKVGSCTGLVTTTICWAAYRLRLFSIFRNIPIIQNKLCPDRRRKDLPKIRQNKKLYLSRHFIYRSERHLPSLSTTGSKQLTCSRPCDFWAIELRMALGVGESFQVVKEAGYARVVKKEVKEDPRYVSCSVARWEGFHWDYRHLQKCWTLGRLPTGLVLVTQSCCDIPLQGCCSGRSACSRPR